ncbi:hypothetical protein [Hymenobacter sp. BT730]|uniref:hypothetical protein n=1 Tax=Hymenobacter sp. BT730 TaxID=3063332 RepID=UPI0026DF2676|nr:hypothetical protein [Hymenobacter sp. BT730]
MKTIGMLLSLILLLTSCKKDELSALPPATQEGKGTAGCLVNGKAWTPEYRVLLGMGGSNAPFVTSWYPSASGRSFYVVLSRVNEEENSEVYFFLPHIRQPGTFLLNQEANPMMTSSNPPYGEYRATRYSSVCYTNPTAMGSLTITRFDTVAKVVSGTFEMHPVNAEGQVESITQGRFDLPLDIN